MKSFYLLGVLSVFIVLFGCNKDTEVDVKTKEDVIYISLNLDASYLVEGKADIQKGASTLAKSLDEQNIAIDVFDNGFFSEYSIEKTTRVHPRKGSLSKSKSIHKVAAKEGTTMPNDTSDPKYKKVEKGVKYMVLIFDDTDNHVGTTLATVGEETLIPVKYREDYEFSTNNYYRIVAFTFNTKNEADFDGLNLDPSNTNNRPNLIFPSDKEFFYHNSDFLLDPSETYQAPPKLSVIFFPQTVRVGVTVDARGVDAKVKRVQGEFSSFSYRQTARFDLKLNRIIERVEVSEEDFPSEFILEGDADSLSIGRFVYMDDADGAAILSGLNLTLKELVIQKNGELNETTVLASPATKSYSFGDVNLTKGKYFNGIINLLSGFEINGVIWSYANLYYDMTAPVGYQHKFRQSSSDGYKELTDYWNFNKEFPKSESQSGRDIDPCTLVYPGGWRMPTKAEASLANPSNNNLKSFSYFDASGSSIERDYDYMELINNDDQKIRFYAFGMRDGLLYSGEGVNALYWLAGSSLSTQADVFRIGILQTGNDSGSGLIDYPDYVTSGARGLNIRCVRTLRN